MSPSIPFCEVCGTILPYPSGAPTIKCVKCGSSASIKAYSKSLNTQKSRVDVFEGSRYVRSMKKPVSEDATISETCPKCGHGELSYYTMQLRSADEGQTAFYTCLSCKHKFTVNA